MAAGASATLLPDRRSVRFDVALSDAVDGQTRASIPDLGLDVAVPIGGGVGSATVTFEKARKGKLVKVYPEIEGGRVLADVEVDGLGDFFAGERTLVWIPVDQRTAISVPPAAISTRYGIDYVSLVSAAGPRDVAVVTGESFETGNGARVEILSGLRDGDRVVTP